MTSCSTGSRRRPRPPGRAPGRSDHVRHHRAGPDYEQYGHDPSALTPRLRAILAIVLIADIVDLMDSTITNIAAPTITAEIGGGESLVKWLGASYALAMGVLLVVGGRLGDRFGKRRMFLVGIAGFGLASLLCGLAVDPAMLIAARLLQGALGALLIPQGMRLLIANFSRGAFPGRPAPSAPSWAPRRCSGQSWPASHRR